jgi:hypothetical protein
MTTLILNWIAGLHHDDRPASPCQRELTMKALFLGMMLCMATGAGSMVLIPDGPLTTQQQFIFGLIAGTIGTAVGAAYFEIDTLKKLARHAVSNLGLAAIFGPLSASGIHWATGIDITFAVVLPLFGTLGIGGSFIFGSLWPMALKALQKRAAKELRSVLGDAGDDSNG